MRILLVEDDPTTSKSIELMLQNANLNVYATDLGEEGIDLARALAALAAPFRKPRIELEIDPALRVDSLALAQTIVRIVQEGITNAVRHADASVVHVQLRRHGTHLQLDIRDDGRGSARPREGHGLIGMRERVDDHGGSLSIDPSGVGFALQIRLPA